MKKGILYGIGAYVLWGFFPIYWKFLHHISAFQLISHRIIWSFVLLMIVIFFTKQWADFRAVATSKTLRIYFIAALLIGINWTLYVWAVNKNYIVETSLGYFINPLISVLLGVIFSRNGCVSAVDSCHPCRARRDLSHFCVWTPAIYCALAGLFLWLVWPGQETLTARLSLRADRRNGHPLHSCGGLSPLCRSRRKWRLSAHGNCL